MLDRMSSMELSMWAAFFLEREKRHEQERLADKQRRDLLGGEDL